jgi:glycolate oxidase iron-sulfur subunit
MVHSGEEGAADMARKTIDLWEKQSVDFIVTNAAGCGSTLKEYGHLLKNDSEYSDRAEKFAAKCRDISEVLASLTPRSERQPIRLRVALHYPCHLQHAQRVKEEPRIMLKTIPELEILEVPETEICCGSAGIYNLVQPDAADELGQRKVQNVLKTEANIVATANPGCLLQIGNGLKKRGVPLRVVHPIEILDASISGKPIK